MVALNTVTIHTAGMPGADVIAVARAAARVALSPEAISAMVASRSIVDGIERDGRPVYGVSTGFGALAGTFVAPERRAETVAYLREHLGRLCPLLVVFLCAVHGLVVRANESVPPRLLRHSGRCEALLDFGPRIEESVFTVELSLVEVAV